MEVCSNGEWWCKNMEVCRKKTSNIYQVIYVHICIGEAHVFLELGRCLALFCRICVFNSLVD